MCIFFLFCIGVCTRRINDAINEPNEFGPDSGDGNAIWTTDFYVYVSRDATCDVVHVPYSNNGTHSKIVYSIKHVQFFFFISIWKFFAVLHIIRQVVSSGDVIMRIIYRIIIILPVTFDTNFPHGYLSFRIKIICNGQVCGVQLKSISIC